MRRFSSRLAALAPSLTVALILFTVGLTGLLAYRAFEASRAQRQLADNTLRDYAGFAAFQLKNATYSRVAGQQRAALDIVTRFADRRMVDGRGVERRPVIRPLGAVQAGQIIESREPFCRCLRGTSFYYQLTFADSSLETTPSALTEGADAQADLRRARDTIITRALAAHRPPVRQADGTTIPASPPAFFAVVFAPVDGRMHAFTHAFVLDSTATPFIAYGYAMPAELFVGRAVSGVMLSQPLLPGSLTRGLSVDSVLAVSVTTSSAFPIFSTEHTDIHSPYAVTDSLDERFGNLRFEVAIHPEAADRLIIGGLPTSRLPEVLATAFVAVALLTLLMYQFRRQEELGRLRDDFVSGVSHELRTPLAQIRLLAELFRMGKVPTDEQKERSLRIIDQEARRLSFLVDSILSFTRAQKTKVRGKADLAPVRTDVAAEIGEIIAGFDLLAQSHGATVEARLQPGINADVDRGALRQVLLNLLDNAVRYGPRGQVVTVTTRLASDSGKVWVLEVADEGPGVPPEERERIFDPYYRMKRDAGGAVGGTGIGLAVVRQLVTDHGGRVHVVPPDGSKGPTGARFVVSLPVDAAGAKDEKTA